MQRETSTIPITPIRFVNERYYPGMFGDFTKTVRSHIAWLQARKTPKNLEKARFFEYLLTQVDAKQYAALQRKYLSPVQHETSALKYFDPVTWFEQKFEFAFMLGLDRKPPMRILDLGTGPGHFLMICRFYGHEAVGTEIPDQLDPGRPTQIYNDLESLYQVTRIKHMVEPMGPLNELPKKNDIVTAFSIAFNRSQGNLWQRAEWDFFLRELKSNVLKKNGTMFFMLVKNKIQDDIWRYLSAMSDWSDPAQFLMLIKNSK